MGCVQLKTDAKLSFIQGKGGAKQIQIQSDEIRIGINEYEGASVILSALSPIQHRKQRFRDTWREVAKLCRRDVRI